MTESPVLRLTFGLTDPNLDDDERLTFSKRVLPELRGLDEVERAERVETVSEENGTKGFETLVGFLKADVSFPNLKDFVGWMMERFADQPISVKVKLGEKEIELSAKSRKELAEGKLMAQDLLEMLQNAGAE